MSDLIQSIVNAVFGAKGERLDISPSFVSLRDVHGGNRNRGSLNYNMNRRMHWSYSFSSEEFNRQILGPTGGHRETFFNTKPERLVRVCDAGLMFKQSVLNITELETVDRSATLRPSGGAYDKVRRGHVCCRYSDGVFPYSSLKHLVK